MSGLAGDLGSTGLFIHVTLARGTEVGSDRLATGVSIIQTPFELDHAIERAVNAMLVDHLRETLMESQAELRAAVGRISR